MRTQHVYILTDNCVHQNISHIWHRMSSRYVFISKKFIVQFIEVWNESNEKIILQWAIGFKVDEIISAVEFNKLINDLYDGLDWLSKTLKTKKQLTIMYTDPFYDVIIYFLYC